MLEDVLEAILISAAGDTILWKNEKYTVVGRAISGALWQKHTALNPEALGCGGPVLLCVDKDEHKIFIPEGESRIILTNPRYVTEKILSYLEKKGAIDWDQLDETYGGEVEETPV